MKKALITGVTGQDGSYLAEFLLSKKYEVHRIIRRASTFNTGKINHIYMDTTKAHKEFGFKVRTKFEAGLKRSIKWYNVK